MDKQTDKNTVSASVDRWRHKKLMIDIFREEKNFS